VEKSFSEAGFQNKFVENDVDVSDIQREWEKIQCDGVTLKDYLRIDEDIAVYESPTDDDIVEDVQRKENSGEDEDEDGG